MLRLYICQKSPWKTLFKHAKHFKAFQAKCFWHEMKNFDIFFFLNFQPLKKNFKINHYIGLYSQSSKLLDFDTGIRTGAIMNRF